MGRMATLIMHPLQEQGEGVPAKLEERLESVETEEEKFTRKEIEMETLLNQTEEAQKQHKEELVALRSAVQQVSQLILK